MKIAALLLAAPAVVTAEFNDDAAALNLYGSELLGYVSNMYGLSASDCSTYSGCSLASFQKMGTPIAPPVTYGKEIIYATSSSYYYDYKTTYTSLSDTLQNETVRRVDFAKDCGMDTVYSSSSSYGPQGEW